MNKERDKPKSIEAWTGCILESLDEHNIPHITIVVDVNGREGIPGGTVEPGEKITVATVREVKEETHLKIMARTLKKIWSGCGLFNKQSENFYAIFHHSIPHFNKKMIIDSDGEIVEARTYPRDYVFSYMIDHSKTLKVKDKLLLIKARAKMLA